jgi:predicted benzoate:H+ symporter BenE
LERTILWGFLLIGIVLMIFSLRKAPIKESITIFLLTAYFSTFIGVIVERNKMVEYPVRNLQNYFETSILYEYLLLPVVCIYFYKSTYNSRYPSIILQCALYTSVLTIIEVLLERYTNLVKYNTWTWMHTFVSLFSLILFVRILMQLINRKDSSH